MNDIKKVLKDQVSKIKIEEKEMTRIKEETENFIKDLNENLKRNKIDAEPFVGGSMSKGTLIKKDKYDIDIFVRFSKKYKDNEISELLSKALKNANRIHGSRDYFHVEKEGLIFEIVPTIKIDKPEDARNVTDLSYFHVKYVVGKTKEKKNSAEEIMLAKAFCYANNCYGAESYIKGFSGYALELLVINYGSFVKFIKGAKDKDKIVLDPEKFYKNKNDILLNLNESKLISPIVFVDPTFKERNALAALSVETFEKFKAVGGKFLKNPTSKFFELQDLQSEMRKKNKNLIIIEASTDRQKGDIAGGKLKRFSGYLKNKIMKYADIKSSEFEYDEKTNIGKNYFVLTPKKEIIISGPPISKAQNLEDFKKKHKDCFIKKDKSYAREKPKTMDLIIEEIRKDKSVKEMDITEISLLK